jgi:uncharacterized protein (TIGR03067 family)
MAPAFLSLTLALLAPLPEKPKDDAEALLGAWNVTASEEEGKPVKELLNGRFTFLPGNKLKLELSGDKPIELTFKLDSTRMPRHIDVTKAEDGKTETAQGIYALDGDRLRLCVAEPGEKTRPTEFKSTTRRITFIELKRVK